MIILIFYIILAILVIGGILYIFSKNTNFKSLEQDYFDLVERHDKVCKELDLARRENKILQEENARLNQAPKVEKVSKPRKTTTKK